MIEMSHRLLPCISAVKIMKFDAWPGENERIVVYLPSPSRVKVTQPHNGIPV